MKIFILSRTLSNRSDQMLKDAAVKRGHEADIIRYKDFSLIIDGEKEHIVLDVEKNVMCDAVIPRFQGNSIGLGIAVLRQFELKGVHTLVSSLAISRANNHIRSLQILASRGIPVPKTFITTADRVHDNLIEQFTLPVIVSQAYGTTSQPVLIETRKTLGSVLSVLRNSSDPIVIQEQQIIAEGGRYKALVVGSSIAASMKVVRDGSEVKYKALPLKQDAQKIVTKVSKATGLSVFEIEIIETIQGPKVTAISAVPDIALMHDVTNRDVAGKIIEYVERNAKSKPKKDKVGA